MEVKVEVKKVGAKVPTLLVGCKGDLLDEGARSIPLEAVDAKAEAWGLMHFETSSSNVAARLDPTISRSPTFDLPLPLALLRPYPFRGRGRPLCCRSRPLRCRPLHRRPLHRCLHRAQPKLGGLTSAPLREQRRATACATPSICSRARS